MFLKPWLYKNIPLYSILDGKPDVVAFGAKTSDAPIKCSVFPSEYWVISQINLFRLFVQSWLEVKQDLSGGQVQAENTQKIKNVFSCWWCCQGDPGNHGTEGEVGPPGFYGEAGEAGRKGEAGMDNKQGRLYLWIQSNIHEKIITNQGLF